MANAGQYRDRFDWLQATETVSSTNGQRLKTYPSVGHLWGTLSQSSGITGQEYDAQVSETTGEIRIRNYVPVKSEDRLRELHFNETWQVTGVSRGDNETIVQVIKYQS